MKYREVLEKYPIILPFLANAPSYIQVYNARSVPANYNIAEKDSPISEVSFICSGHLAVVNEFYSGNSYVLDYAQSGDIIGLEALFANASTASVTLKTLIPTVIFPIPRSVFQMWLETDPAFLMRIARYIGARHYAASYRSGREIAYPPLYCLANLFLQYAPFTGISSIIRLTRPQMAEQTGLCTKTINRTIKKMCESDMISVLHGKVHLSPKQVKGLELLLEDAFFPDAQR